MRKKSFYVGGRYVGQGPTRVMAGQMYVESLARDEVTHTLPIVLIHGGGQTAMNWLTTPDGRAGWAEWFAANGWHVHVVDQPARGRSAWQPTVNGELRPPNAAFVEKYFTAPEVYLSYPQAHLHTQWPGGDGKGRAGDPHFDQFFASQVPSLDREESETLMKEAGIALLERIGPAILITHSQAGPFGWLIADARPDLVKAIVALEPSGPPYQDAGGGPPVRQYGITRLPLAYDPPVTPESPLAFQQQDTPDRPCLAPCWSQAGSPRRLSQLSRVPVLVVTAQASYHAAYDHCTAEYLKQAGVAVEFVDLSSVGLTGNGHMMMLEKNSDEIASFLNLWMSKAEVSTRR